MLMQPLFFAGNSRQQNLNITKRHLNIHYGGGTPEMPTPVANFLGPRRRRQTNLPKDLGKCLLNDISFCIKTFVLMLVMENLGNTAGAPSENAQKDAQIKSRSLGEGTTVHDPGDEHVVAGNGGVEGKQHILKMNTKIRNKAVFMFQGF